MKGVKDGGYQGTKFGKHQLLQAPSLCWKCKNAIPDGENGCSWSKNFKPVRGWTAIKNSIKVDQSHYTNENKKTKYRYITSYRVLECPEFKPDDIPYEKQKGIK